MSLRRSDDPLDTYLLRVFVLLITERSVSRTALRLNQSQPAVSAAIRELEEENAKLKRLVADLSLDKAMLQDVVSRKL